MEAIAALSLACNILQLAETSLKAASVFRQAYKHDSTKEHNDAVRLSENLSSAVDELQLSTQQPLDKHDAELDDIAQQCLDKATKIQNLNTINSGSSSSTRKRDKLRRSVKAVQLSFSGEMKDLETDLQNLRKDLDTRVLISLRSRYDLATTQQGPAFTTLRTDIRDFIIQQSQLQNLQHQQTRQTIKDETAVISKQMQSMKVSVDDQTQRAKLLKSLSFPDINARKNQISDVHPDTFEWLFKENTTGSDTPSSYSSDPDDIFAARINFHDWLRTGQQVYWVSGKPGSGKSTLMSFVARHNLTRQYLRKWSQSKELVLLEGYLWNAGTKEQRTYRGLLGSLLTQIFNQLPDLLDSVLRQDPDLCRKSTLMDWSSRELQECLLRSLKRGHTSFCVFIDGLDEAEVDSSAPGTAILQFIDTLAAQPNVKCCVSSRPLRKFEIAFAEYPCLKLQYLNAADIGKYFDDNASSIFAHAGTHITNNDFETLRRDFCAKADGVFLWACLAVSSLRRGVENCDNVREIRERLDSLPPELEHLYQHMWEQQNNDVALYQSEASLFFNICLLSQLSNLEFLHDARTGNCCGNPLNALHFLFIRPNNKSLQHEALAGIVSADLKQACKTIQAQVSSRCAGLLECRVDRGAMDFVTRAEILNDLPVLQEAWASKVVFVHRTARDFLLTSTFGQSLCNKALYSELELRRLLCRARLCELMIITTVPQPWIITEFLLSITCDHRVSEETVKVLAIDIEAALESRVLMIRPLLDVNNWFTHCGDSTLEQWSDQAGHDILGATLLAGASWSARNKLKLCVGDRDFAYRAYLLYCCLEGIDLNYDRESQQHMIECLFEITWSIVDTCSRRSLQHVLYPRDRRHESGPSDNETPSPCRPTTVSDILLASTQVLTRDLGRGHTRQLELFETICSLPFTSDQKVWFFGYTSPSYPHIGPRWTLKFLRSWYNEESTDNITFLFQCTFGFLLQCAIEHVQVLLQTDLRHLPGNPVPLQSGLKIEAVLDRHERRMVPITERATSDALITLLGYGGSSGPAKFGTDIREDTEITEELHEAIVSIATSLGGGGYDSFTYLERLGAVMDVDDPRVGQWPPPLHSEDTDSERLEAEVDEEIDIIEDDHNTSTSEEQHQATLSGSENNSDDDEFFDIPEKRPQ